MDTEIIIIMASKFGCLEVIISQPPTQYLPINHDCKYVIWSHTELPNVILASILNLLCYANNYCAF